LASSRVIRLQTDSIIRHPATPSDRGGRRADFGGAAYILITPASRANYQYWVTAPPLRTLPIPFGNAPSGKWIARLADYTSSVSRISDSRKVQLRYQADSPTPSTSPISPG